MGILENSHLNNFLATVAKKVFIQASNVDHRLLSCFSFMQIVFSWDLSDTSQTLASTRTALNTFYHILDAISFTTDVSCQSLLSPFSDFVQYN